MRLTNILSNDSFNQDVIIDQLNILGKEKSGIEHEIYKYDNTKEVIDIQQQYLGEAEEGLAWAKRVVAGIDLLSSLNESGRPLALEEDFRTVQAMERQIIEFFD
jgi:hypothetical protein